MKIGMKAMPLALLLLATAAAAGSGERWIHVRVLDRAAGAEQVSLNLPLSAVASALPAVEAEELSGGRLHLDDASLDGVNLREVLDALRDSPDTDFVRLRDDGETVRIAKDDGRLVIHVDDPGPDAERVRVVLPLDVVEAMLVPGSDEIDLVRGLHALADYGGDLVRIESDTETVRVWIDTRPEGK